MTCCVVGLRVIGTDLKIVIYTAALGSEDATKLDLTRVTGVYQ